MSLPTLQHLPPARRRGGYHGDRGRLEESRGVSSSRIQRTPKAGRPGPLPEYGPPPPFQSCLGSNMRRETEDGIHSAATLSSKNLPCGQLCSKPCLHRLSSIADGRWDTSELVGKGEGKSRRPSRVLICINRSDASPDREYWTWRASARRGVRINGAEWRWPSAVAFTAHSSEVSGYPS